MLSQIPLILIKFSVFELQCSLLLGIDLFQLICCQLNTQHANHPSAAALITFLSAAIKLVYNALRISQYLTYSALPLLF